MVDLGDPNQKFAADVAANVFMEIFKKGVKGTIFLGEFLKGKSKEYDVFGSAYRTYRGRMEERYNVMKIIGMNEPRPLREIYVRVNILKKILSRDQVSRDGLEEYFDKDTRGFGTKLESTPGIDAVDQHQKLIVLGKPGAGKTTFLRFLALMALDGKLKAKKVPIIVVLKEWADSGKTLLEFIVEQFDLCGVPDAKSFVERMLNDGHCLLLLDGFDEVTVEIDKSVTAIENFSIKYPLNNFVLSCRIAAWNWVFEHFTDIEMADFDDEQIETFIYQWFGEYEKKAAGECWGQLQKEENVKELAKTPLLLTLLCLTYSKRLDFPKNRSELYKTAVNALLVDWNISKKVRHVPILDSLTPDRKENLLSVLAAKAFEEDKYFIEEDFLTKEISKYVVNLPVKQGDIIPDSKDILKALEKESGLIVERAKGIYSFSHLTIQEYLTARYIVENREEGSIDGLIESHILDDSWREVFLLTAGMLTKADGFFKTFRNKITSLADDDINAFLEQIDKIILPGYKCPDYIARLYCVFAYTKNETLREIISAFIKEEDNSIDDLFFDFTKERIEKPETLDAYINAAKLLLDCLNTECFLSADLREQLFDGLKKELWGYRGDIVKDKRIEIIKPVKENEIITIGLKLPDGATPLHIVKIPAGTFTRGEGKEKHKVTISQDYYLGKYPVTQAQWEAVMINNPSYFKGMNKPVEQVLWDDCNDFIEMINKMNLGVFRLPTEAEWEYACRADTTTEYYWGDDPNEKEIWNHAWYYNNSFGRTHEVGKRWPNAWGLHDMSGNVWEWCSDWYGEYSKDDIDDPKGKESGSSRVVRGGCWCNYAFHCWSAWRLWIGPGHRYYDIGFRVIFSRTV